MQFPKSSKNEQKLIEIIKDLRNRKPTFETSSKWERGVIYNLCKLLHYDFSTIKQNDRLLVGCDQIKERAIKNGHTDYEGCGCFLASAKFHKNHHDNNYEDTVSYSYLPWTWKKGVKVIYS